MEYEIGADETIAAAVVTAVSAVEGRDPLSLRPLAEVLDPDALNSLFDSQYDDSARSGATLTFVYSKCRVTVENGGKLMLQTIDPRTINGDGPDTIDG